MSEQDGERAEEQTLLAGLRANDPAAYETLVRRHLDRMLAVARRFLGNEEDARDAVQDAFLSAFKGLDRFEGSAQLSTWLHRIVLNAALMKLRKKKRRGEASIESLLPRFRDDGHAVDPPAPWRESAEAALQRKEIARFVREAIDQLPDIYREVLLLRDIEEVDTEESARILSISEAAVKTRLHRARQALRELLDPHLRGESP